MKASTILEAGSDFFVSHAEDRFGRLWNWWAVWYIDRNNKLKQTGDEPIMFRFNAQRLANRYNEARARLRLGK